MSSSHRLGVVEIELSELIGDVLKRTPAWLRRELSSTDDAMRQRAEAALTAMIAAAVSSAVRSSADPVEGLVYQSSGIH